MQFQSILGNSLICSLDVGVWRQSILRHCRSVGVIEKCMSTSTSSLNPEFLAIQHTIKLLTLRTRGERTISKEPFTVPDLADYTVVTDCKIDSESLRTL